MSAKLSQALLVFPDVSVRASEALGWGHCVCVGGGLKEEIFTAVLGRNSIYKFTFRKITSCISPPQFNNFFHSLFIYNIIQIIILHTIHHFIWGDMCDLRGILFISLSTFKYLHHPSFRFTQFAYNTLFLHYIKRLQKCCFLHLMYKTMMSEHKFSPHTIEYLLHLTSYHLKINLPAGRHKV